MILDRFREEVKQKLTAIVAPICGHSEELQFQGPVVGKFLSPTAKQLLYIVSLDWITAERRHVDGDRVFAVVLQDKPRVWELEGGGEGLRSLSISPDLPDVLVTAHMWFGHGETQNVLRIFSLADEHAKAMAATDIVYDDACHNTVDGTVADRVFFSVDGSGQIKFTHKEHWFTRCEAEDVLGSIVLRAGSAYKLIGHEQDSAEDALVRMTK